MVGEAYLVDEHWEGVVSRLSHAGGKPSRHVLLKAEDVERGSTPPEKPQPWSPGPKGFSQDYSLGCQRRVGADPPL